MAAVGQGDKDAMRRRLPEGRPDLTAGPLDYQADQPPIDRPAGDGEGLDDRERVGIEGRDPTEQDLDQRRRALTVRGGGGLEQLLDEQRMPLGASPDRIEDL